MSLAGQRFNRWLVIGASSRPYHWLCRCDCGTEKAVFSGNLTGNKSKSCGCLRREVSRELRTTLRHGEASGGRPSPEYKVWRAMRQRCTLVTDRNFPNYGGRGIKVTERWERFENFLADMGRRPSPAHSLDRIDVNGNYEPSNCRWATLWQQTRNKRTNVYLKAFGVTAVVEDWAEQMGIAQSSILARIRHHGTDGALFGSRGAPPTEHHAANLLVEQRRRIRAEADALLNGCSARERELVLLWESQARAGIHTA